MFARSEPQADHSKAACEPRANYINRNLPRSGPQFVSILVGQIWPRTGQAEWTNQVPLFHFECRPKKRFCSCVYTTQRNKNLLVKISLYSTTSGQKLHMVPLSDIFSAQCLQTVELFLYCSFAIFTYIRDLQPPVWLYFRFIPSHEAGGVWNDIVDWVFLGAGWRDYLKN